MEEAWKRRLKGQMTKARHTMKSLSLAAGLGETSVRDMLKRTQSPSVDAVAKVAKALGMTLSQLYEGDRAPSIGRTISSVDLIGQVVRAEASWFPLAGIHTIFLDDGGASPEVRRAVGLVAMYDGDSIAIFEKLSSMTLSRTIDDSRFLILTKRGDKFFASLSAVENDAVTVVLPGSELELELTDVEWIAKWKQTIPRSLV